MKINHSLRYIFLVSLLVPVSIVYGVAMDNGSTTSKVVEGSVGEEVVEPTSNATAPTGLPISPLKRANEVRTKAVERQTAIEEKVNLMQDRKDEIQTKVEEVKTKIHEKAMLRCQNVESRISLEVTRYQNHKNQTVTLYDRVVARLNEVTDRLKAKGLNTTALESQVVVFQGKVDGIKSDYDSYIMLLEETKQYTCGQSEGDFRNKLSQARNQLQKTRGSILNTKSFYQNNVVPELQALKDQARSMQPNLSVPQSDTSNTLN